MFATQTTTMSCRIRQLAWEYLGSAAVAVSVEA